MLICSALVLYISQQLFWSHLVDILPALHWFGILPVRLFFTSSTFFPDFLVFGDLGRFKGELHGANW